MADSLPVRHRWSLTQGAFDMLLARLDEDRERAGEKYERIRLNLVRFFEGRGCAYAEEYADEAINRVARKVEEGEQIENFSSYFYGVARMLLLESHKEQERERRALGEFSTLQPVSADFSQSDDAEQQFECLNQCLGELPTEGRALILSYYQGDGRAKIENRKKLAAKLGIPLNALRRRALRLREKLEACVANCLGK